MEPKLAHVEMIWEGFVCLVVDFPTGNTSLSGLIILLLHLVSWSIFLRAACVCIEILITII